MALAVANQWQATAADQDAEIITYPAAGDWLIATITCRVVDGSAPILSLGDVSRNLWTLLASDTLFANSTHAGAQTQVEVWACPAARYDGWSFLAVYAAAMQITASDVGSVCVNVSEWVGFGNGTLTVDSITIATATLTPSLSITTPAPAANCLILGVAATDNGTPSVIVPNGTGFFNLTQVSLSNPNLVMTSQWKEAATAQTATWTTSPTTNVNWAGIVVAIRATGNAPAQPNAAWPATQWQVGHGYGLDTPLPRVRWTDQTSRYLQLDGDRGIQAELGMATQGMATVVIRDDDGAYSPRPVATAASANAAGTTTTIKVPDASAANIHATDFFRLQTSGGVLKELNVFQVVSLASSGGTTTVTFKRADGTAGGALAATASGDVYAGIPIDLYIPWRLLKTIAGKTHVAASGWLRDLPLVFSDAHWAEVQAAGADAIETLTAANPSALRGEIARRPGLYAYWPLDDASGSGYAQNASGLSTSILKKTVSKYGAGVNVTSDFGASTQDVSTDTTAVPPRVTSLLGDPGSAWAQTGQAAADMTQKGYALVGYDPGFPSLTSGVTILGAVLTTHDQINIIANATIDPTVMIVKNTDPAAGVGQGAMIRLAINHLNFAPQVTVWDKGTHVTTVANLTPQQIIAVEWTVWALVFDRTSWACYINGALAGSGTANLVSAWSGLDIGGEADQFFHGRTFPGAHAHVAVFGRKLTAAEVDNVSTSALTGRLGGESADKRINKKLNTVGWKGTRALNSAPAILSAEAAPSGSVADAVNEVASWEDSLVFADAANQLQYRNRVLAYQQSPRAILGDGPGEIPYQPGQRYDFNPTFIYNATAVANTRLGGYLRLATSTIVAIDDTSQRYGSRTLARSTRYSSDSDGWHIAYWWLSRYSTARQRVSSVVVSAAATADATRWAFVLGVEVGDLLTVNRRPIGQPAISIRCRVLRVAPSFSRRGGQVTGQVTLTLAAAPPIVTVANDANYGPLAGTVMGA